MQIEFSNEDSGDVMCRFIDEKRGYEITVITAPEESLGEDGPVVTQISNDSVIVVFSDEFVERKIDSIFQRNVEEMGEQAMGVGIAYIMNTAVRAAEKKFAENEEQ